MFEELKFRPKKREQVHLPDHDPELVEIIEETLDLQKNMQEEDNARKNQWDMERRKARLAGESQEGAGPSGKGRRATQLGEGTGQEGLTYAKAKTHEEILAKNTNYVFIFGYTGAGKSTVLTAINMYMRQNFRVILNQAGNEDGIRLIHQMMRDVEEGQFPLPTSIGHITEYDSAFLMNGEDVNLTFLEMAGEDLKRVDVDTGEEGFPETVKAYLSCPGISISFLIVADFDRVVSRKEDKLILQFLSYLYNEQIDMSRVGVVLSKFDRGRTEMDVEEAVKTYLPQVDKWLSSGDIAQPRIFPFSIGQVKSYTNRKDEIAEIDLGDCAELVPWLHQVLSLPGARPKPPKRGMMDQLRGMFKK